MATSALQRNQQHQGDSNAQQPTVVRRNAPCAVSGIFQDRQAADRVLRRLIDLGVKRENISLIGKNLHSETQVTGFVSRGDVIKDGLQTGAIFGAFFGTMRNSRLIRRITSLN